MKRLIFILGFVAAFVISAVAQCPTISVMGPSGITVPGENWIFTAKVEGADLSKIKYQWTVSVGKIVSGQGTPIISVPMKEEMLGEAVTATVKIIGLPENCPNTASATGEITDLPRCPTISVTGPSSITPIGEAMTFTAKVEGVELEKIKFEWTVDKGTITNGQGTSTITVATNADLVGESITVMVKVIGLPQNCQSKVYVVGEVSGGCGLRPSFLIDEFAENPPRIRKKRLENFRVELSNNPTATAYIVEKFKRETSASTIKQRIGKTFFYLTQTLKIEKERINLQFFYGDENLTKLWIVPVGGDPPDKDVDKIEIKGETYQKKLDEIFPTGKKKSQPKTTKKP